MLLRSYIGNLASLSFDWCQIFNVFHIEDLYNHAILITPSFCRLWIWFAKSFVTRFQSYLHLAKSENHYSKYVMLHDYHRD